VQKNIASGDVAVGGINVVEESTVLTLEDSKIKNSVPNDCVGLLCE
jgi:hypothetical protein